MSDDRFLRFLDHFYDSRPAPMSHHQHQTPYRSPTFQDKYLVVLCDNNERMRFKLNYVDRELFDVAKEQFPHTDDEVHIPLSFCNLTYGEPAFSPCVYTATTDYLQARWGRKLDDSDRLWLGKHPYAADGGIPREYTLTCIQQMLEPYDMGIARVRHRKGIALVPPSVFEWCIALGCNPFAMVDHQTSNQEAAERMGLSLEEANKLWRFEFSDDPLPCSIIGEQGFEAPDGQRVVTGARGGHARYLPPRGRFNDWFISCQLDFKERITYDAPTPNPEYVPRRGSPMLQISQLTRPDGKPLAVKGKRGYITVWMSPEEAEAAAAEQPTTPVQQPHVTTVIPPAAKAAAEDKSDAISDTMHALKLPRLYDNRSKRADDKAPWSSTCPVAGCRTRHTFPTGMTMQYLGYHRSLALAEWRCKSCIGRFTTTDRMTRKEFKRNLATGLSAGDTRSGGAEQANFPGWCKGCAKVMDPGRIEDGLCEDCWWTIYEGRKQSDPAAAPTVDAKASVVATVHCVGCGDSELKADDLVAGTGFCTDCFALAFDNLICGHEQCKVPLDEQQTFPHFLGKDADSNNFSWACTKCGGELIFDERTQDVDLLAVILLSRILALPENAPEQARLGAVEDWDQYCALLEFEADMEQENEMRPVSCGKCRQSMTAATSEMVQREPDGSIIFACQNLVDVSGKPCGALSVSRPALQVPLSNCPACHADFSVEANRPSFRGVRDTGVVLHGCQVHVPYFICNSCSKSFMDMRGSNAPLTLTGNTQHVH